MSVAVSRARSDSEIAQKALLQRLFPDVQVKESSSSDLEGWLKQFAKASEEAVR